MSRLIDADKLEPDTEWSDYYDEFMLYSQHQIRDAEEVKAISVDRIKRSREEMTKLSAPPQYHDYDYYICGVEDCLEILDKLIAESEK